MSVEIKASKKKWPYLWYDPQTGLPFDFKPDNEIPRSPIGTRTTKLREELLKKPVEEQHAEPFPRHVPTTPTSLSVGTTKTQRLREMLASKVLEEHNRRDSAYKLAFKARTPPSSTREAVQTLRPHKSTNSQRLREEFSRKVIEKRNEDTIAAFMETHRRIMSAHVDTSPPITERQRSQPITRTVEHKKTVTPVAEKRSETKVRKSETKVRPIRGKSKKSITSLKSQAPLVNKRSNKSNLARERYSSEPKLSHTKKTTVKSYRTSVRNQERLSAAANAKKPQSLGKAESTKVNKAVSKNRVNFLKEKMKKLSLDDTKNAKKTSYTEECLKTLSQSRATLEKAEKASEKMDKNFKVILPPAKERRVQEPCSPSSKIRRMVQDALSTTGEDSSGSES